MADLTSSVVSSYSDTVFRLVRANAEFMIGWSEAYAEGYRTFLGCLDEKNITRLDFDNGLIQGAMKGWLKGLELMPKAFDRSLKTALGQEPCEAASAETVNEPDASS